MLGWILITALLIAALAVVLYLAYLFITDKYSVSKEIERNRAAFNSSGRGFHRMPLRRKA